MIVYYNQPPRKQAPRLTGDKAKKKLAATRSRISGQVFEEQIAASLAWYEYKGIMAATKTPEPMKPVGRPFGNGHFEAVFTKPAQVDFSGTLAGGRAVRFEAKQTDTDRFRRDRLTEAQMQDLRKHDKFGALCFVILAFGLDRFYRLPWYQWDHMKERFGRCYVTENDLTQFRLPFTGGAIRLLDGIAEPEEEQEAADLDKLPPLDTCVLCGEYAGEGSHICPRCLAKHMEVRR